MDLARLDRLLLSLSPVVENIDSTGTLDAAIVKYIVWPDAVVWCGRTRVASRTAWHHQLQLDLVCSSSMCGH